MTIDRQSIADPAGRGEGDTDGGAPFLSGGGEMGELIRTRDWCSSPLGPPAQWPQSLRNAVSTLLASRAQICLFWGPDLLTFYNDAYRPVLGAKHPEALGRPVSVVWGEIWQDVLGPLFERVMKTGEAFWASDHPFFIERHGYLEETYFDVSYDPVGDERGGGVFCIVSETSERVVGARRLRTLRDLGRIAGGSRTVGEVLTQAAEVLCANPFDLPFAILYERLADGTVRRGAACGVATPTLAPLAPDTAGEWPLAEAETAEVVLRGERLAPHQPLPGGPWPEPARTAVILPIAPPGQAPLGYLVAGISPRRELDESYRDFLRLVASNLAAAASAASALEEQRARAEALAELDRAKTAFFSNISHEFRTPLTLMLGPLEEVLRQPDALPPAAVTELETVRRNGQRLLRLVNNLLDFSRLEAGRVEAACEPVDLAAFTVELASTFRSAVERAGLRLITDCPRLDEPVHVDRGMWEKIVLNLLSNAFKFTLAGEIEVKLRSHGGLAELSVRDTGLGIPPEELPHLFERFHRVEGARGRTHEGTGIGLALVRELARLHGGSVRVASSPGAGSTFTVAIPLGTSHLPADRSGAAHATQPPDRVEDRARSPVDAALAFPPPLPPPPSPPPPPDTALSWTADRPLILLADDNADMRSYVERLLADRFAVRAAADGEAALAAALEHPPALVLSDVMMPGIGGLELLHRLRADPRTRGVPVILLSARAGEESRIAGLQAGADDYLVKPFSATELLARIQAHVKLAQLRHEAIEELRQTGRELRRDRELLQAIVNNIPVMIALYEPNTEVLQLNAEFERLLGWTSADAAGLSLMEQCYPDPAYRAEVGEFMQACRGEWMDIRMRARDGRELETSWAYIRLGNGLEVGIGIEMSDRKRAEEAQAMLAAIVQSSDDAIVSKSLDGVIRSWNAGAERLFGFTAEQAVGRHITLIIPPERTEEEQEILARLCEGQRVDHFETVRRRSDGREIDVSLTISPVKDRAGRIIGASKIARDITLAKRAAEALKDADRRKDEFLATLAHELRNPLAPIRNSLEIMKQSMEDPDRLRQSHQTIDRQLAHLVRMVDDLLDVSRISTNRVELRNERVELAAVIHSAVETSRPLIDAGGHQLTVSLPEEQLPLDADPVRLAQVFSNLLNNAARYSDHSGQIRLSAEREGAAVVVRVGDDGIGIPADSLPWIFDMFVQVNRGLERSRGGLGIGLTLVHRMVELHGGTVEARSAGPGKGSEFIVRLPLAAVQPAGGGTEPAVVKAPPAVQRLRRILVADDNQDSADSLSQLLSILGYETATAYDGLEALDLVGSFQPDVVLLDLGMPKLNGFDVARRVRERWRDEPIVLVALTGWGQEEDRRKTREAGFDHHLVKPVDLPALEALLRQQTRDKAASRS